MKRTVTFLLLLTALILSLVACQSPNHGENTNSDENYTDQYLYTYRLYGGKSVYCRINVETGTVSPLCPDPLCSHDNEKCCFYGMDESPRFCGKYIYYLRGTDANFGVTYDILCRFDLENGEYRVIYESEGGIYPNIGTAGNYVQFCIREMSGEESGFILMLLDRTTGKITQLNDEPLSLPHQLYAAGEGRLYWQTQASEFYSTDEMYGNRIAEDKGYSDHLTYENTALIMEYTGQIKGAEGAKLPMYKVSLYDFLDDSKIVVFEETPAFPFLYRDKIMFFKLCDEPPLLGYEKEMDTGEATGNLLKVYEKHGGKLYICDRDGSNERLLLDINGTDCTFAVTPMLDGKTGAEDWIGVELFSYIRGDDGNLVRGNNKIMLVNIITGESKLVSED